MALTLTITDDADGSGGTATIAGSAVGSVNSVWSAPWTGQVGPLTWSAVGGELAVVLGDGSLDFVLTPGLYLFRVDSVAAGSTAIAATYQAITNAAAVSLHKRIMDAVKVRIDSLSLTNLPAGQVLEQWLPNPWAGIKTFPSLFICPIGNESFDGGLTSKDDIGLPVAVILCDKQNQNFTANLGRNTDWRWKISKALRFQKLAGVPEVINCKPEGQPVFELGAFQDANMWAGGLMFRFVTRTTRG